MPARTRLPHASAASGVTSPAQLNCVFTHTLPLRPSIAASSRVTRAGFTHGARVQRRTTSICASPANARTKRMTSSSGRTSGSPPEMSTSRTSGWSCT